MPSFALSRRLVVLIACSVGSTPWLALPRSRRRRPSSSSSTGDSKAGGDVPRPEAKGYYKKEKLAVTIDAGNGSGGTVTRVASGAYDMGFADLAPR